MYSKAWRKIEQARVLNELFDEALIEVGKSYTRQESNEILDDGSTVAEAIARYIYGNDISKREVLYNFFKEKDE